MPGSVGNNYFIRINGDSPLIDPNLIDNMIKLIKRQTKSSFKIILTGGLADLYENSINTKSVVDKDLTINGIIKITKNLL